MTTDEKVPTPTPLTAATLHSYVLYSSRPVIVIEVVVVFSLIVVLN